MSQQRSGGARQKLAITRLSHIFIVIHVVNSLFKLAKSIQPHLSNCLEAYLTVDSRSAGAVAKISFGNL